MRTIMRKKERQMWTELVEKCEREKKPQRPHAKRPEVSQTQLEQALDDLVKEPWPSSARGRAPGRK